MTIALILAYALIGYLQIRSLAERKLWRDLAIYSALMAASCAVSLMLSMGVRLPNPIDAIQKLLEMIGLHY